MNAHDVPARPAPSRVQLSRRAGHRLPPNTVSVAAPSRYANPYRPARRTPEANREAVELFRTYLQRNPALVASAREELAGRNLACWCRPELPCHADVWLDLVNNPTRRRDTATGAEVDLMDATAADSRTLACLDCGGPVPTASDLCAACTDVAARMFPGGAAARAALLRAAAG